MSRSNHKQETVHRQAPQPWFWLLIGLLIGIVSVLLFPFQHWLPWAGEDLAQNKSATLQSATETEEVGTNQIAPPQFEFYTLLPEREVAVPEPKPKQSSPPPQPRPQPETEAETAPPSKLEPTPSKIAPESATYVLQAGSFRSHTQADKRKAFLALMGIEAAIQTVTIDNSKTWHRVRIGPSTNLSKLRQIRQQLHEKQIESQLYKVKS